MTTTNTPRLELRAVKYAAWASEETSCYTANVYLDGKHVAFVGNDGHGGPDRFNPAKGWTQDGAQKAIYDVLRESGYCAEHDAEMGAFMKEHGLRGHSRSYNHFDYIEAWCGKALELHLTAKDLRRDLNRRALFTKPDAKGVYTLGYKGSKKPDDRLYQSVLQKYPGAVILNRLPFEAALGIFYEAAKP